MYDCFVRLKLFGEKEHLDHFFKTNVEDIRGYRPLLFEKQVPIEYKKFSPTKEKITKELSEKMRQGIEAWRNENWGTQFEPYFEYSVRESQSGEPISSVIKENNWLAYFFKTVETPPDRWLFNVGMYYPEIIFCLSYANFNIDSGGLFLIKKGGVQNQSRGRARAYFTQPPKTNSV